MQHKIACKALAKDLQRVKDEAVPLLNTPFGDDPEPQNVFETQVGNFRQGNEPYAYMAARRELAMCYYMAAMDAGLKCVWEKVLFHALAMLRLDVNDSLQMRLMVPFILLYLNRDDDAFDFMRYLLQVGKEVSMDDLKRRYLASREGEWIYPHMENCRFLDLFKECAMATARNVPTEFLVALLIIKVRLIATYDSISWAIDVVFETSGGQRMLAARGAVRNMLMDSSLQNLDIDSQREQVERLLNAIDGRNPSILKAICDPEPFENLCAATCSLETEMPRNIEEAWEISRYCGRCFHRIPGAQRLLQKRMDRKKYLGPNA